MTILRLCLALTLLTTLNSALSAQRFTGDRECATVGKSEWLKRYQAGEIAPVPKSANTQYVPLTVFLVGDDNGVGYIDPVRFLNSMVLLNSDFRDMNIQFFIKGNFRYINNTRYNNHDFATGRQMMSQNNVFNTFNTYVVESPAGACGYYSPSRDAIALGKNCLGAGDRTWSHEVGHYLSRPHTFYGWESIERIADIELTERAPATLFFNNADVEVEKVDGSNCATAADGFCDTPPDFLMERWACNGLGFYRDSLTDPDSVRFAVPASNIMSYALDNCVDRFTEDQKAAMLTNLDGRLGLVNNAGASTVGANVEDLTLLLPEDNATLPFSDSLVLTWSSVPNADFYVVQMNRTTNFNGAILNSFITSDTSALITEGLIPRGRYFWRVRPVNRYVVDGDFGEVFRFRNGEFTVASIDPALDAAITVSPNPVSGGQQLRIQGRDLGLSGTLSYELISATGQVLHARRGLSLNASGFNERLETGQLPAGIYFLRLQLNDRLVTRRIIVTP